MSEAERRRRFHEGLEAGVETILRATPLSVEFLEAILRCEPDPDDDLDYDSGFRAALDSERLRIIMRAQS